MFVSDLRKFCASSLMLATRNLKAFMPRLPAQIKGGYLGNKVTVSPALLASTTALLQSAIISASIPELKSAIPSGYIMYDSAVAGNFSSAETSIASGNRATVGIKGTIYGSYFQEKRPYSQTWQAQATVHHSTACLMIRLAWTSFRSKSTTPRISLP